MLLPDCTWYYCSSYFWCFALSILLYFDIAIFSTLFSSFLYMNMLHPRAESLLKTVALDLQHEYVDDIIVISKSRTLILIMILQRMSKHYAYQLKLSIYIWYSSLYEFREAIGNNLSTNKRYVHPTSPNSEITPGILFCPEYL